MTRDLTFVFEAPQAGWLPLRISSGEDEVTLDVSNTPNDFLDELVTATLSIAEWEGTFAARIHEEPEQTCIKLTRLGNAVTLAVEKTGSSRESFSFVGPVVSVVLPIWRALRRLEAGDQLAEWPRPFSSAAMEQLTEVARRIKPPAA